MKHSKVHTCAREALDHTTRCMKAIGSLENWLLVAAMVYH